MAVARGSSNILTFVLYPAKRSNFTYDINAIMLEYSVDKVVEQATVAAKQTRQSASP